MKLLPTVFLSALSTSIGMICSFFAGKVLAIFVGATGFAVLGQFSNFILIVQTIAGNMYQQGVMKYSAQHQDDPQFLTKFYQTASALMLITGFLLFLILECFAYYFSVWLFHIDIYISIIRLFGVVLVLFVFNNFFLSILNGLREIRKYIFSQIIGSIFGMLLTVVLVFYLRLWGALLSLVFAQSGIFFFTAWLLFKTKKFPIFYLKPIIDSDKLQKLLLFASMSILAGIANPLSQLLVRSYLMHHLGAVETGCWQAMNRLTIALTGVITTALSVYYIPTLASLRDKRKILLEIFHCYKIFIPILVILSVIFWFCRDYIIIILFTKQFEPMRELFLFQLMGVFFQIASWIICNLMWAKAMYRVFIISEIIFVGMFVLLTIFFTNWLGFQGSVMGFFVNYMLYFAFSVVFLLWYTKVK